MPAPSHPAAHYRPLHALLLLVGAQMCFTLLDATGKHLARDMGVPLISLVRHAVHALLMLTFLVPVMGAALLPRAHLNLQLLRGLMLAGFTLFFFTALRYLPQADATAINFITPFLVMLLAGPILGERIGWPRWSGAALGFAGMLLILRPRADLAAIGVLFVLLTVACNVAFQLLTRKLSMIEHPMATIFLTSLTGVAVSAATLPLQEIWGGWPESLSGSQIALLASLGVTGTVSQWCLVRAYYWSSASFLAPLTFLQIGWAVLAGFVFFGQLPDSLSVIGIA
ncbi:MAG: DMT family transporter, partial [Gammaproteobacteria bacterium]